MKAFNKLCLDKSSRPELLLEKTSENFQKNPIGASAVECKLQFDVQQICKNSTPSLIPNSFLEYLVNFHISCHFHINCSM